MHKVAFAGWLAAAACVTVLANNWSRLRPLAKDGNAGLEARMAALEAENASAKKRVAALEGRVCEPPLLPSAAAAVGSVTAHDEAEQPPLPDRTHRVRDLGKEYASTFAAEAVDPAWAQRTQSDHRAIIDGKLPETSRVESFECRSEFCRLEVVHESIAASNDFLRRLFAMESDGPFVGTTGGFRAAPPVPTEDGKLKYVVYIARPGTSLELDM